MRALRWIVATVEIFRYYRTNARLPYPSPTQEKAKDHHGTIQERCGASGRDRGRIR